MRFFLTQGFGSERGAGDAYWDVAIAQAAKIHNKIKDSRGDGLAPYTRRTDRDSSLQGYYPMFCLAYVRTPPALRTSKLHAQAEKCMHLGMARRKPGYMLEVLEGPRKGKIVFSSQVVFRPTVVASTSAEPLCMQDEVGM